VTYIPSGTAHAAVERPVPAMRVPRPAEGRDIRRPAQAAAPIIAIRISLLRITRLLCLRGK
jgi:hypothetical protein